MPRSASRSEDEEGTIKKSAAANAILPVTTLHHGIPSLGNAMKKGQKKNADNQLRTLFIASPPPQYLRGLNQTFRLSLFLPLPLQPLASPLPLNGHRLESPIDLLGCLESTAAARSISMYTSRRLAGRLERLGTGRMFGVCCGSLPCPPSWVG